MLLVVVSRCRAGKKKLNKVDQKKQRIFNEKTKNKKHQTNVYETQFLYFRVFCRVVISPETKQNKKNFHAFHLQPEQKKNRKKKTKKH